MPYLRRFCANPEAALQNPVSIGSRTQWRTYIKKQYKDGLSVLLEQHTAYSVLISAMEILFSSGNPTKWNGQTLTSYKTLFEHRVDDHLLTLLLSTVAPNYRDMIAGSVELLTFIQRLENKTFNFYRLENYVVLPFFSGLQQYRATATLI